MVVPAVTLPLTSNVLVLMRAPFVGDVIVMLGGGIIVGVGVGVGED